MENIFIEYPDVLNLPYNASSICFSVAQYAKNYIEIERDLTCDIDYDIVDAVLIDIVQYLASVNKIRFHFNVRDLYSNKTSKEQVDGQTLLYVLFNHLSVHLFNDDIVISVLMNSRFHNWKTPFDRDDAVKVIVDFINFVAEDNNFYRKFTVDDLEKKYNELSYKNDMINLKRFLEDVNIYLKELDSGKTIDELFKELSDKNNLKYISRSGNYHLSDEKSTKYNREMMNYVEVNKIDQELYKMAYACYKYGLSINKINNYGIKNKILEMKKNKD